jgi:NhaP-type Na+/H+ or K+/H+ antiporter
MSTNAILLGLGLVIVLAIASRLLADRLGLPAIVILLPVGFVAGIVTDDVNPDNLFGATFTPLVDLGVGLILFEAGLRLRFHELRGGIRRVVLRLISVGTLLTLVGVTVTVKLIFGESLRCSARSWSSRGQPWCCRCSRSSVRPSGCARSSSGRERSSTRSEPCWG